MLKMQSVVENEVQIKCADWRGIVGHIRFDVVGVGFARVVGAGLVGHHDDFCQ